MSDYSTYDSVIFCLNKQSDQPTRWWEGLVGSSSPAIPTEFVKNIEMGMTGNRWQCANSGADANRPQVVTGGGMLTGTLSATTRFMFHIYPATDPCRQIHEVGIFDLWLAFETNAGTGSDAVCLLDNTNFSSTLRGLQISMTLGIVTARINNGSAAAVSLATVEACNDNTQHVLHFHAAPGAGNCSLRVDKGTRIYGTLGTLGSGAANIPNISLGNRGGAQTANDFEGTFGGVVGSIGPISAAQQAEYLTDNPYGNIAGWPEVRSGLLHFNLYSEAFYCPTQIYFGGKRVSDASDADGAVYAWDNSSGWQGSGHGLEPNQPEEGGETVISVKASIDGGAWVDVEDGDDLEGNAVVSVERVTSTVAFSEQRHTMTAYADGTKLDRIRMVRNGVAGSGGSPGIRSMYPIRNSRAPTFTAYLALDKDGNELDSGVMGAGTVTLVGARAVAQFDSTLGIMALIVMTKGHEIPGFQHIILDVPQNKRIYQEIESYQTNVSDAEGTAIEMASTTKFYETDAGSWEALAASEVQGILGGGMAAIQHRRRG